MQATSKAIFAKALKVSIFALSSLISELNKFILTQQTETPELVKTRFQAREMAVT